MRFRTCYLEVLLIIIWSIFSQGNGSYSSSPKTDIALVEKLARVKVGDKTALLHQEAKTLLLQLKTPGAKVRGTCEKLVTGIARDTGRNPTTRGVKVCDTILTLGGMFVDLVVPVAYMQDASEALLNIIVVFLFRNEGEDCLERLLCEANKQAASRRYMDAMVAYLGNLGTALFCTDVPLSKSWDAIRFGKLCCSCEELYPRCPIFL